MVQACVLVKTFGTGAYVAVTVLLLGNVYLEHVCLSLFLSHCLSAVSYTHLTLPTMAVV